MVRTCWRRITSPISVRFSTSFSTVNSNPRRVASAVSMSSSSSTARFMENASFDTVIFPLSIRLISRISLINLSRYWDEDRIFPRFSLTCSGTSSIIDVKSLSPTMAFMGVRISWLILERNSPFARLAASALSRLLCILAARILERAAAITRIITARKTHAVTVTNITGLAYINSTIDAERDPMVIIFWFVNAVFCSLLRLLTDLFNIGSSSPSTGLVTAKQISFLLLTRVLGTTLG